MGFKYIKSLSWKLIVVVIVAVVSLLLNDLYFLHLPELFKGGKALLNTYYNLCIGVVVSFIFYFIVVHIKEVNDNEHLNEIIIPKVEKLLEESKAALGYFCKGANVTYNGNYLSKNEIINIFKNLDPNKNMQVINVKASCPHTWLTFLIEQSFDTDLLVQSILKKQNIIEPKLLRELSLLEESSYFSWFKSNPNFTMANKDMEIMAEKYFDFLEQCKKIENIM